MKQKTKKKNMRNSPFLPKYILKNLKLNSLCSEKMFEHMKICLHSFKLKNNKALTL